MLSFAMITVKTTKSLKQIMDFYYLAGSTSCHSVLTTAKALGIELKNKLANWEAGEFPTHHSQLVLLFLTSYSLLHSMRALLTTITNKSSPSILLIWKYLRRWKLSSNSWTFSANLLLMIFWLLLMWPRKGRCTTTSTLSRLLAPVFNGSWNGCLKFKKIFN